MNWIQLAGLAVPTIGVFFVMHERLARALERISALEAGHQRQGERIGAHDLKIGILEDRAEHTQPGTRRRPTRGVPGAGE